MISVLCRRSPDREPERLEHSGGTFYILLVREKFDVMHYHVLHALLVQAPRYFLWLFPAFNSQFGWFFSVFSAIFPTFRWTCYCQRNTLANLSVRRYYLTARFIHLTNWQFGNLAIVKFMTRLKRSYRYFYQSVFNIVLCVLQ